MQVFPNSFAVEFLKVEPYDYLAISSTDAAPITLFTRPCIRSESQHKGMLTAFNRLRFNYGMEERTIEPRCFKGVDNYGDAEKAILLGSWVTAVFVANIDSTDLSTEDRIGRFDNDG